MFRGVAEQEISGADLRLGLGCRAVVWLSDHKVPSYGGTIRKPWYLSMVAMVPGNPFLTTAVSKARADLNLRRHLHATTSVGNRGLHAIHGSGAGQGLERHALDDREADAASHPPADGGRSGLPAALGARRGQCSTIRQEGHGPEHPVDAHPTARRLRQGVDHSVGTFALGSQVLLVVMVASASYWLRIRNARPQKQILVTGAVLPQCRRRISGALFIAPNVDPAASWSMERHVDIRCGRQCPRGIAASIFAKQAGPAVMAGAA